jgi:SsrA-binding protein
MAQAGEKTVVVNRRARHDYEITEVYEAGISLTGPEVKSLRAGKVSLAESYAKVSKGEVWLIDCRITPYTYSRLAEQDPVRPRRLLLRKNEIRRLIGKTTERGFTLIPLRIYFKRGWAKVELGLAKGKKLVDKREKIKRKIMERESRAAIKQRER